MFKHIKALALGAALSTSLLMPAAVSADATTFVPNTTSCWSGTVTTTQKNNTFQAKWNNDNTFDITVGQPLTTDVTLFASSYHLTSDLYKGGCFSTDAKSGTYPQTYDNNTQTITLPKGFSGTKKVVVVLPTTCYNEQVDLYSGDAYGRPLNNTVTKAGHGNYGYIAGNIMLTANNAACQPGKGGGDTPTTPETPVTPVTPTPEVTQPVAAAPVATLADTGSNTALTSVLASAFIAAAAFIATRRTKTTD